MQSGIEILRPGTFTAVSGQRVTFGAAELADAAASYDPALHEAPIVVGHPQSDGPAYGWVTGLQVEGERLVAAPGQVDPAFAELVAAGRYKKVSASFYGPDAAANPKPGHWYLRHVGFLGAQPPAVKGLKAVSLAEGEDGVVELAEARLGWVLRNLGAMLGGLRDMVVADRGVEAADTILPAWRLQDLNDEAARAEADDATPAFTEHNPQQETVVDKTDKTAAEAAAALEARAAELDERQVALAEQQKQLDTRAAALRGQEDARAIDQLVAAGKVLPAQKDGLVAFMASLGESGVVSFGEGEARVDKKPARDFLLEFLGGLPKRIELGEVSGADRASPVDGGDAVALSERIVERQAAAAAKGRIITTSQALAELQKGAVA